MRGIADGNGKSSPLTHQHDKPLAPCQAGVEEIARQHGAVLRAERNDHGGIFRALRLVDGGRIGQHQFVQLDIAKLRNV